jgi:DNA modification methylase
MILIGDVRERLKELPDQSVNCCVTSPPYWGLRDYGNDGQIGLEQTPADFIAELVAVFREVKRVLRDDGTLWLNLGDSYANSGTGKSSTKRGFNERYFGKEFAHDKQGADEGHVDRSGLLFDVKTKDLVGIPWRVAFALQADGWYLRQDIIWHKPNPMPESVRDRCTKAHEYIFLLSKSPKYYFDNQAIQEDAKTAPGATWKERKAAGATAGNVIVGDGVRNGTQRVVHGKGVTSNLTRQDGKRNKRSVWTVTTRPFQGAHFATFPPALIEPCILAGSPRGGVVLDPFFGAGTTGLVAQRHGREWIGCELNPEYAAIAKTRIEAEANLFTETA